MCQWPRALDGPHNGKRAEDNEAPSSISGHPCAAHRYSKALNASSFVQQPPLFDFRPYGPPACDLAVALVPTNSDTSLPACRTGMRSFIEHLDLPGIWPERSDRTTPSDRFGTPPDGAALCRKH